MSPLYEYLINELKSKLYLKRIKFKQIFKLINNKEYDKIIEIIDDENIQTLIDDIVSEQKKIVNDIEKKLNNLIWLNERLIQFGEEQQLTITQARKLLKTKVFINIYDLESENYKKRTTRELLKKELRKKPERNFPLLSAKENKTLKSFLIKTNRKTKKKPKKQ
jgi:hypothetical protein